MQTNPFEIVMPLFIRSFIRETNGEILAKKKDTYQHNRAKPRKILPHKPVFGTVEKTIFVKGEPGLLPDNMESTDLSGEHIKGTEDIPPWEQHLQYGNPTNTKQSQNPSSKTNKGISAKNRSASPVLSKKAVKPPEGPPPSLSQKR
jgi:hypothetical protein